MGRQHQGMDRPGIRRVPEGSGEQGKMEETGCEIILVVKGQMMKMTMTLKKRTDCTERYVLPEDGVKLFTFSSHNFYIM